MSALNTCVKKVIAEFGEREIVNSSETYMDEFILDNNRPEFDDDHVLAVKFIVSTDELSDDKVETSWFVNPIYAQQILESIEVESYVDTDTILDYLSAQTYGPQIASEFLPELLLLIPQYPTISVLDKYSEFRVFTMIDDDDTISDIDKYTRFLKWFRSSI